VALEPIWVGHGYIKLSEEKLELESFSLKMLKVEKTFLQFITFLGSQAPTNHSTNFI
jgi:hypothetical protein